MDTSRPLPASRVIARPVALFLGFCAASAMATAALAWAFLPYEAMGRFSPEVRFLAWEGVVWLIAMVLGFLGITCVLQVAGGRLRQGIAELVRHLVAPRSDNPIVVVAALLPWGMIAYGLFLALIGVLARATVAP